MKDLIAYLQTVDRVWLATWTLIYVSFVSLDAFFPGMLGVSILKILGIVLCLVYAWQKFRRDAQLIIALGLTLLADSILLLDNISVIGVFTFCFAQFFHLSRLKKAKPIFLIVYSALVAGLILVSYPLQISPIYPLAVLYGITLFYNIYLSWKWHHKKPSIPATCALFGFLLFFCCDFCVGISYLSVTGALPLIVSRFANYFAWVFYYPSQVLISNSSTLYHHTPKATSKKSKKLPRSANL
ncbi:hypothetical protein IK112_02605 [Candidatus Saccharibacteria bacterium]|nr:hypothetical protein [Candidatus Saccharibacteria bacterium]